MRAVGTLAAWRELVVRTLRGVHPGWARPDDARAREQLTPREFALYRSMDPRDRDHASRVAGRLAADWPQAPAALMRAAWLHDIGKADRPYRLLERVGVHLWCPGEASASHFPRSWQRAWRVHREHAALGAARLAEAGVDAAVVAYVAAHHAVSDDPALQRLQRADRG